MSEPFSGQSLDTDRATRFVEIFLFWQKFKSLCQSRTVYLLWKKSQLWKKPNAIVQILITVGNG